MSDLARQLTPELQNVIRHAAANAPRSLQAALGPSEVGTPCTRRLAYRLLDWLDDKPNPDSDPLPSTMGTAYHAWLAEAFERPEHGGRYLVEKRVEVTSTLGGSCDLYDTHTDTVIDWKVVGASAMSKYKAQGPREQYQIQAHLYGIGFENAGHQPKNVALAFIPRGGMLTGMWVWTAPYDRQKALDALARLDSVYNAIVTLDPEATPANWSFFPAEPGHECTYCPWFKPGSPDLSLGCPSEPGAVTPRASLESLIA